MSDDVLIQARALLEQANALEKEVNEFFDREAEQEGSPTEREGVEAPVTTDE